jgi:EmrB/QacA subfamily drug resistance transporter
MVATIAPAEQIRPAEQFRLPVPVGPRSHRASTGRHRRRRNLQGVILLVLIGAQMMIWIDNTILNVALATLADPVKGLGASPEMLEWSINSYTLAFASCLLIGGSLGDRWGRRTTFWVGLVIFGLASAGAAFSGSAAWLLAFRGVMGVGSALVVPATLGLIRELFDGAARTRAVALWSASGGLAIGLGPLVGGWLLEHYWWGSIFLINVPIAAICCIVGLIILPRVVAGTRLDFPGLALSASGLGLLVLGIVEAGRLGDWTEPMVMILIAAGIVLLAGFVVVELRTRAPSFDVRLFGNPGFSAAGIGISLAFFGLIGSTFCSVFYLQGVQELTPLQCGAVVMPIALGVLVGAPIGMRISGAVGPRGGTAPCLVVVSGSMAAFWMLDAGTSLIAYDALLLVQGIGIGAAVAPLTDAVVTLLPSARAAAGAAVNAVLRQVGTILGVAVLGSLLVAQYREQIAPLAGLLPSPAAEGFHESAEAGRVTARAIGRSDLITQVNDAFLVSMHRTSLAAAGAVLLGAIVLWLVMPARRRWLALVEAAR